MIAPNSGTSGISERDLYACDVKKKQLGNEP